MAGILMAALALAGGASALGQNQNQAQSQGQSQGAGNKIQAVEQVKTGSNATTTALERRSQVANAVQEMLRVADRNGGIGAQVRVIAQAQNQNREELEGSLEKVRGRSGAAKFLVGPNYGEINNAEKLLEQNREKIQELNEIKSQLLYSDQQILAQQIKFLEQANIQIQNELDNAGTGFSLLGWMFKMFKN